jgi:predicted membrane channel-forming protein YqfA (hemolysin III family)
VAIMISSNISNIILTSSRLYELIQIENSTGFIIFALFCLISLLIFRIAETEKLSFVFYICIGCLLFLQTSMFVDNLRLIWLNGNLWQNLTNALWSKPGSKGGYGVFIGMLAYAFEMADCYLASKNFKKQV